MAPVWSATNTAHHLFRSKEALQQRYKSEQCITAHVVTHAMSGEISM
jgi:hypothetical protein